MMIFAVGWSLEMSVLPSCQFPGADHLCSVIHLEELCFWLFLVNSGGSGQQDWFKSPYFKIWIVGSAGALIYMPVVTALTRNDVLHCEASSIFAGALGSLVLTLWFIPILFTFPNFLNSLKAEGVEIGTIVRLTKFHEMNVSSNVNICQPGQPADGLTFSDSPCNVPSPLQCMLGHSRRGWSDYPPSHQREYLLD